MIVKNKNNYHFMPLVLEGAKRAYLNRDNKIKVNNFKLRIGPL